VNRFIESNEVAILATLRLFDKEKRKEVVQTNKEVVRRVYSPSLTGKKLYQVISGLAIKF